MESISTDEPLAKKARINGDGKADPFTILNDQCLETVLSFVGFDPWGCDKKKTISKEKDATEESAPKGETAREEGAHGDGEMEGDDELEENEMAEGVHEEEGKKVGVEENEFPPSLKQVFTFYQRIASVSRQWRFGMDLLLTKVIPLVEIDLSDLSEETEQVFVEWACCHKLGIVGLKCGFDDRFIPLAQQLVAECDTKRMELAKIRLSLANKAIFDAQRTLHDLLAKECPLLDTLIVIMDIGEDELEEIDRPISKLLFSHKGIQGIVVKVLLAEGARVIRDGGFLCGLTQNLPRLDVLYVECDEEALYPPGGEEGQSVAVQIVSPSLTKLRLQNFCTVHVKILLSCPRLVSCGLAGLASEFFPHFSFFSTQTFEVVGEAPPRTCSAFLFLVPGFPPLPLPFAMLTRPN